MNKAINFSDVIVTVNFGSYQSYFWFDYILIYFLWGCKLMVRVLLYFVTVWVAPGWNWKMNERKKQKSREVESGGDIVIIYHRLSCTLAVTRPRGRKFLASLEALKNGEGGNEEVHLRNLALRWVQRGNGFWCFLFLKNAFNKLIPFHLSLLIVLDQFHVKSNRM